MKIRVSAIRRKQIDTTGLLTALVDLSVQLQRQRSLEEPETKPEAGEAQKEAPDG